MSPGDKPPTEVPFQKTMAIDWSINPTDDTVMVQVRLATNVLSKWIIDTRDKAIREALIRLGWTPPPPKT